MNRARPVVRACASLLLLTLSGRPARAQPVVIPRGHEEEIAVMLGRAETLPGGCRWAGADIGPSEVRARYDCGAGPTVALRLSLPGRGPAGAVSAGAFDVSVEDPGRAALREAVAARVRGGRRAPMVVAVSARPASRRLGPFAVGASALGGDDLTRSPWLDLPVALLLLALVVRALRPVASKRDLALAGVAALAFVVFARAAGTDVPVHPDTLRDLLFARDCVEGGRCHALGPQSGLAAVRHGTLWLRAPEWAARLGADERALRAAVELWCALAVLLLALGARRHGAPPSAPLVALAAGVASHWLTDHPLLWHPSAIPLFAALYVVLLADAARASTAASWVAAGAALGLLFDAHPSTFALLPCFALVACALSRRPWSGALLGLIAAALANALPSPLLALSRVAAGDRRGALLLAVTLLAALAGLALRRRAARCSPRLALTLTLAVHAAAIASLAVASGRDEGRYLAATIPLVALGLACWSPPRRAATGVLATLAALLVVARLRHPTVVASWSIAEARAVLRAPPLRGRPWIDLVARLQMPVDRDLLVVAGLVAPPARPGAAVGPDALLALRTRRGNLPPHPPSSWTVVPLSHRDVAVLRPLRSFLPLGPSRACVDAACVDLDLAASLAADGATRFSPRAFGVSPPMAALARRARPGQRLRLTLAVAVPGGATPHRIALAAGGAWRIDGASGAVRATPGADGSLLLDGADAATGTIELSAPAAAAAAPPGLVETAADEAELGVLLRRR